MLLRAVACLYIYVDSGTNERRQGESEQAGLPACGGAQPTHAHCLFGHIPPIRQLSHVQGARPSVLLAASQHRPLHRAPLAASTLPYHTPTPSAASSRPLKSTVRHRRLATVALHCPTPKAKSRAPTCWAAGLLAAPFAHCRGSRAFCMSQFTGQHATVAVTTFPDCPLARAMD